MGVGIGAGGQGEDGVDDGLEASGSYEAHDAVEFGLRAHVGAEQRKLAAEEESQIDLGVVAGGGAASYQTAAGGETGQAVVPGSRPDEFQHNIDAPPPRDPAAFI